MGFDTPGLVMVNGTVLSGTGWATKLLLALVVCALLCTKAPANKKRNAKDVSLILMSKVFSVMVVAQSLPAIENHFCEKQACRISLSLIKTKYRQCFPKNE